MDGSKLRNSSLLHTHPSTITPISHTPSFHKYSHLTHTLLPQLLPSYDRSYSHRITICVFKIDDAKSKSWFRNVIMHAPWYSYCSFFSLQYDGGTLSRRGPSCFPLLHKTSHTATFFLPLHHLAECAPSWGIVGKQGCRSWEETRKWPSNFDSTWLFPHVPAHACGPPFNELACVTFFWVHCLFQHSQDVKNRVKKGVRLPSEQMLCGL
jgi:hypothetical protein